MHTCQHVLLTTRQNNKMGPASGFVLAIFCLSLFTSSLAPPTPSTADPNALGVTEGNDTATRATNGTSPMSGTKSTRDPSFHWSIETDPTTLSYVQRHVVGTVLHSIFLFGLVVCCVLGVGGICIRVIRGQPLVEKFAAN
jgi:hypothetical protein